MSWDFYLCDPATMETLELPNKHLMTGGTYRADYDEKTGEFTPSAIAEAWLNVTYNYSRYYYEASDRDLRFYVDKNENYIDLNTPIEDCINQGIRALNNRTGEQSICMFDDLIMRIKGRYFKDDDWITTKRTIKVKNYNGKEIDFRDRRYLDLLEQPYDKEIDVYEGDTSNYWFATAALALRPLYQLKTMATLRPDGVWKVE